MLLKFLLSAALLVSLSSGPDGTTNPPCPPDMVGVPGGRSCIDRYEWPNKAGQAPAVGLSGLPEFADVEAGRTMDAESLCASVGKRVCGLTEWNASCRGPERSRYPFGESLPDPRATTADNAPCNYAQTYTKPDEKKVYLRDPAEMTRLDRRDPSGARGCVSASGAEDMMGNVEEWVRCSEKISPSGWCLAGRFWSEPRSCGRVVAHHDPRWHFYETGTRCCKDMMLTE